MPLWVFWTFSIFFHLFLLSYLISFCGLWFSVLTGSESFLFFIYKSSWPETLTLSHVYIIPVIILLSWTQESSEHLLYADFLVPYFLSIVFHFWIIEFLGRIFLVGRFLFQNFHCDILFPVGHKIPCETFSVTLTRVPLNMTWYFSLVLFRILSSSCTFDKLAWWPHQGLVMSTSFLRLEKLQLSFHYTVHLYFIHPIHLQKL